MSTTAIDRVGMERLMLAAALREVLFHFPVCNPQDNNDQPCDCEGCAVSQNAWELLVSLKLQDIAQEHP